MIFVQDRVHRNAKAQEVALMQLQRQCSPDSYWGASPPEGQQGQGVERSQVTPYVKVKLALLSASNEENSPLFTGEEVELIQYRPSEDLLSTLRSLALSQSHSPNNRF